MRLYLRMLALSAAVAAPMLFPTAGRADVDTTARWVIRGVLVTQPYIVAEDWTQTGTAVTTSSGYGGAIDPMTGAFSMTRPPSPPCAADTRSGTVAADGLSLTGSETIHPTFTPSTCFFGIGMPITGSRCPSGTIEPGEGCDDGNIVNGDGCDSNCDVEPCWSCSGTPSVCVPSAAGTACGDADGIACTTGGTCDASQHCVETPDSSLCDDGNACTIDTCDPMFPGGCRYESNPCDDGNPCTTDGCLGDCTHDPAVRFDCRTAMSSTLALKDGTGDHDKLSWSWSHGQSTTPGEYSDPAVNATYTFCVFAGNDNAVVAAAELPPDAARWHATSNGFSYLDPAAAVDGITRVKLVGDLGNRAKIGLKGKGAGLDIATPPFDLPITTQLMNSQSNVCWTASYDAADVRRNAAGRLSARAKVP